MWVCIGSLLFAIWQNLSDPILETLKLDLLYSQQMASAELLKMNLLSALHTTWYPATNYISREVYFNVSWNFPSPSPSFFSSRQYPSRVKKDEHMAKPITDVLIAFNFCPWACLDAICGASSLFSSKDHWDGTFTQAKAKIDLVKNMDTVVRARKYSVETSCHVGR